MLSSFFSMGSVYNFMWRRLPVPINICDEVNVMPSSHNFNSHSVYVDASTRHSDRQLFGFG